MKALAILPLAFAASGPALAADPLPHGSNASFTNISCKTVDLTPGDGVAPYAVLLTAPTEHGPFGVAGALKGPSAEMVQNSRRGAGLDSLYLTVNSQGSSGTSILAPSGIGTVGLLSASSTTAPGRVLDAYEFVAVYRPTFRLGPNSAVKCTAQYVVSAWAKPSSDAPDSAASYARAYTYESNTGNGGGRAEAKAFGNPHNGARYSQKSGQMALTLYNYGGGERMAFGIFIAEVLGGPNVE